MAGLQAWMEGLKASGDSICVCICECEMALTMMLRISDHYSPALLLALKAHHLALILTIRFSSTQKLSHVTEHTLLSPTVAD